MRTSGLYGIESFDPADFRRRAYHFNDNNLLYSKVLWRKGQFDHGSYRSTYRHSRVHDLFLCAGEWADSRFHCRHRMAPGIAETVHHWLVQGPDHRGVHLDCNIHCRMVPAGPVKQRPAHSEGDWGVAPHFFDLGWLIAGDPVKPETPCQQGPGTQESRI